MDNTEKLRGLEDQVIRTKGELILKDGRIEELEYELAIRESKLLELTRQLDRLKRELDRIHQSAMFRTFRRIARVVDRLFPDGTLRGRFRITVIGRLQSKEIVPK